MKYLITGGAGFLGSNLASKAMKCELGDVFIFDNLSRLGSLQNKLWLDTQGKYSFVHGDIRNINDVENIIKEVNPDVIFHLAGQVAMTTSIENPRKDFEINTIGSLNILDTVRKYSPDTKIIYSSTNKVYGDLEYLKYEENNSRYLFKDFPQGISEDLTLDFHSPYGCSKGAADQYMLDYNRIFGIKTMVFRHSSMYGGRQFATYDQGWVGWFCQQAINQKAKDFKPFSISGNGKQVRDLLYVDDMIELYFKASLGDDKTWGQAYNIGGGIENSLSLRELFSFLEEEMDISLSFKKNMPRISDQKIFIADLSKITRNINWKPIVNYKQGLREMLKWVQNANR